jgi:ABC-2 type transport system permease protein
MNFNIISAITRKDLIDAIRHRYLLTALVTPLFVAMLFRLMLPSMDGGKFLTLVVHDAGSSGLVAMLRETPRVDVVQTASADATAREIETRKAIGGVVIPANFDADMTAGKQPELTVYVNHEKTPFEQAAFRQLLDRMVRAFSKQPEPARLVWVDIGKDANDQPTARISLDQILLPLLLILTFGMTGAFIVPLLIVEEKEKRTLDFLLSSPASLKEILAGKALTGMGYTLLIAGLLLGLNRASVRNWPLTFLTVVVGLLFVVAVGLVVGSLLKNTMQVNTWASIVLMVLLAPSFPSIGISKWFDTVMRFIPTYYLSEALKLSMAGTVSSKLWTHLAVLLGCTIVVFFMAVWALKRRS